MSDSTGLPNPWADDPEVQALRGRQLAEREGQYCDRYGWKVRPHLSHLTLSTFAQGSSDPTKCTIIPLQQAREALLSKEAYIASLVKSRDWSILHNSGEWTYLDPDRLDKHLIPDIVQWKAIRLTCPRWEIRAPTEMARRVRWGVSHGPERRRPRRTVARPGSHCAARRKGGTDVVVAAGRGCCNLRASSVVVVGQA